MAQPDFVIAGAGIIGLSLGLELHHRGASVTVLDQGLALGQASSAAAGMLAVHDPANPPGLRALAQFSASLYPAFLDRLADLSGIRIPFQTTSTLQTTDATHPDILSNPHLFVPELARKTPSFHLLAEHSIDPRQLAPALLAAIRSTSIDLREHTALTRLIVTAHAAHIETSDPTSHSLETSTFIDCMGAWSPSPLAPRKGQMLAVAMPRGFDLQSVVRTEAVYIVPRTEGPHAGRAIIGATLEDTGFDRTVRAGDILALNARAIELLPALAEAEFIESWSGLRPATIDGLPLLGAVSQQPRYVLATGHFRNGILLAPATAVVIADLLFGLKPPVDLLPFAPARFSGRSAISHSPTDIRTNP